VRSEEVRAKRIIVCCVSTLFALASEANEPACVLYWAPISLAAVHSFVSFFGLVSLAAARSSASFFELASLAAALAARTG
jgi:hypothetical protein